MAYTSFAPSSIDDLLSQVANFAGGLTGWSAGYASGETVITPKADEATFSLTGGDDGSHGEHISIHVQKGSLEFVTQVDHIGGLAQVFLFAGNDPEPWLHGVINSRPGEYHHFYIGYLQRYGDWSCGAIAGGTAWDGSILDRDSWTGGENQLLFSKSWQGPNVSVDHIDGLIMEGSNVPNGGQVGRFEDMSFGAPYAWLRGGPVDNVTRSLVYPGLPIHNGVAPMAPILILGDLDRDNFWVPLGTPPGIRLFNIADFTPGEVVSFGANDWQVFPLSNKYRSTSYNDWPEEQAGENTDDIVGGSEYMGIAVLRES